MPTALDYKVVLRRPADLKMRPNNARAHDRKQKRALAASIRRFGFTGPVLVDRQDMIIAGHARVEVAIELGLAEIPTIGISHLTPAELEAYVIADNRTAELASWDKELLAISLTNIGELDADLDLSITGFSLEEIELLGDVAVSAPGRVEDVPVSPVAAVAISRRGDLWQVGDEHLVLCGDATDPSCYRELLGKDRADLVITDPPFNCPIDGHVSGLGEAKHREFVMASGEMTLQVYRRFLSAFMDAAAAASRSGAVHYIFGDWRIIRDILDVGNGCYDALINLTVWHKTNAGMGSFLRSQHELIAIFRKGRRRHLNNVALGANGRHRTNVWTYPGANSFGANRQEGLAEHPTIKPTAMIADAVMDASHAGDLILDPFGGSGTTLLACQQTRRRARLMELDPLYVDLILRRAARAGLQAILLSSGRSFDEVSIERQEMAHV